MPEKDDSFRNLNLKGKTITVAALIVLIILVAGFVLGLYFFGMAGIFKLLGVQYHSFWSLVIFVVSYFFLGMIVGLFSHAIYKLSIQNMTGQRWKILIRIGFEFASNWLVLFTVDEFMASVTLSWKAEIVIALLISLIEIASDSDKEVHID